MTSSEHHAVGAAGSLEVGFDAPLRGRSSVGGLEPVVSRYQLRVEGGYRRLRLAVESETVPRTAPALAGGWAGLGGEDESEF